MVRYEGWRKNNTNTEVTIAFYRQCCIWISNKSQINFNFICNGQRVFDAIVEGKKVMLEVKTSKNELILIPWDDVVIQVDAVKDMNLIK